MGLSLGGNDNQTVIEVTADATGAVKGFKAAEDAQQKLEKSTISLNKSTEQFTNKYVSLSGELGKAAGGFAIVGAAVAGLGVAALELAKRGEAFGSVRDAFIELGGSSSVITEVIERTRGLVTQTEAYQLANSALVKEIPDVNKNFADLAALGTSLADVLGREVVGTTNQLISGIGRAQPRLLTQLGIFIDSKRAFQEYAESIGKGVDQLNAFEKKAATQNALLAAAKDKLKELGEENDSVANAQESFNNRLSDALDIVGAAINENPELTKTVRNMSDALEKIDWAGFGQSAAEFFALLAKAANTTLPIVISVADQISDAFQVAFGSGLNAQVLRAESNLRKVAGELNKLREQIAQAPAVFDVKLDGGLQKQLPELEKKYKDAVKQVRELNQELTKQNETQSALGGVTKKVTGAVIDHTNAKKKDKDETYKLIDVFKEVSDHTMKQLFTPQLERLTKAFDEGRIGPEEYATALDNLRNAYINAKADAEKLDSAIKSNIANLGEAQRKAEEAARAAAARDKQQIQQSYTDLIDAQTGGLGTALNGSDADLVTLLVKKLQALLDAATNEAVAAIKGEKSPNAGKFGEAYGELLFGNIGKIGGAALDQIFKGHTDQDTRIRRQIEDVIENALEAYNNIIVNKKGAAIPFIEVIIDKGFGANSEFNQWLDDTFVSNPQIANAFTSVGEAFAEKLGLGFEEGGKVFAALLQQLGATEEGFNNLKVIVLELGLTLEESTQSMVDLFKKGQIGALEAEGNIQSLNEVFAVGRVGVGDYTGAIKDLIASGGSGVRAIKDLKDIGVEAHQANIKDLEVVKANLIKNGTLSVEQANALFNSIAANGITTVEGLAAVSDRAVISILAGAEAAGFAFGKSFDELTQQLEESQAKLESFQGSIDQIPELQEKRVNFIVSADVDPEAREIWNQYTGRLRPGVAT